MSISHPKWVDRLIIYSPILVCLAIMLPRLASPHFGLFDDGLTIKKAHLIASGHGEAMLEVAEGRSRPVYWLFNTAQYSLFGLRPLWFFATNTLLLGAITATIIYLAQVAGANRLQAWSSGLLFALSGPIVESFYTLSKPEPLQLVLLCASLVLISLFERVKSRRSKLVIFLNVVASIALANAAKETTLVVLPISLVWFLAAWLRKKWSGSVNGFLSRRAYFAASLIGSTIFVVFRMIFVAESFTAGNYTRAYQIELGRLVDSAIRWTGWLIRDDLFIIPALILVVVGCILKKRLPRSILLFDTLVWMGAWLAIYLPWPFAAEYYLLPFAFGCAMLGGILLAEVVAIWKHSGVPVRWAATATLGLTLLLFLGNLANNVTNANLQLTLDAANAKLIDFLAAQTPPGSKVMVNIQYANEYVYEIKSQLSNIKNRDDLIVVKFKFQGVADGEPTYIVSPKISNQPVLSVRSGVVEATQTQWNKTLQDYLKQDWINALSTQESFRLFNVNYVRWFCGFHPSSDYCTRAMPLIDRRVFSYGWDVFKASSGGK